jgi:hypothetical protein
LHYLWSSENPDTKLQPGQAIHLNFATSYELIEKRLRVGVNGYYLKALTKARVDGDEQPHSQEQVFGIGPGLIYSFSQNDHLFANLYFEMAAENRTEGQRCVVRWVHHF